MAKKKSTPTNYSDLSDIYNRDSEVNNQLRELAKAAPQFHSRNEVYKDLSGFYGIGNTDIPQIPEYGESRYDEIDPTLDDYLNYQELRAQKQPWYDQIKNGILKGAITTGTTFANTLVGIPVGLVTAVAEGRLSGIWDNAITNTMQNIDDWAEKELPNYYTAAEQNNPWYQNIFTSNFLGDKLIKNFGFTFGAGAAGKVISKMPKLLTTIAPKIAKATGATAQNIASVGRVANTLETGFISAVGEGSIEALQATKEWSADMTNKINQEQTLKLQALQQEYQSGLTAIQQQYGNTEIGQQIALSYQKEMQQKASAIENETNQKMAQVASQRAQLGNAVLGFNIPILTLSNIALLGRIYAKGWSAEQQSLGRFISSDMSKLAAAGTTTSTTTRNILGREITKDVVNNVYKNNLTLARNILRGGKQAFGEGTEEMSQLIASNTAKAYNNDYYAQSTDPDATDRTANMWYSLAHQFGETLGDINNWEEFFIGMVSGGISNIVLGANKELAQERRDVQNLVDALNERVNTFSNRNLIQGLNRHGQYGDQMVESAIRGDKKDFKDAEFAQTVSDVIMWAEAGKLDDLKQIIDYNLDNNLTDEELENIAESLSQKDSEGGEHNSFAAGSNSYRRQYIQDQKDKYHKVVDLYTQERENLVSLVGSTFSKEELSELTYLRLRAQDSATRSEELQNNLLKKIDTFAQRNLVEQASAKTDLIETSQLKTILRNRLKNDKNLLDQLQHSEQGQRFLGTFAASNQRNKTIKSLEKRIQNTEKLLAKDFTKAVENEQKFAYLKELLGVQTANTEAYTSAVDFIKANFKKAIDLNANKLSANNVLEVAQNINDLVNILGSIKTQDTTVKELETTIEDAIRLVSDADAYNKKLNEFINKPEKIAEKNEGLAERARNKKIDKEAARVEQDIADTVDFNEFSRKLDSLDPRVKERVLKNLKNKQNKNAIEYDSKTQKINLVLSYIATSEAEPRIKQLSTALFDNAARILPEEDLFNIDSNIYSREANQQLDDNTYVKVKTLLAEAFKFQGDETSEPVQEDVINLEEKPVTTKSQSDIEMANVEFASPQESFEELQTELSEEGELPVSFEEQPKVKIETESIQITPATQQTHGFKEDNTKASVALINIADNNLTSKEVPIDEKQTPKQTQPTEPESKGAMAMGMQEFDKKGANKGKPVTEEVDSEGKPTKAATNSKVLYDSLKELGAFDNVDNGVVQKGSKVYFGIWPLLDRKIQDNNNYTGTTILLFVDGKCVGHLPSASSNSAGKRLGLVELLREEFKDKLNNDTDMAEVYISKKYYTTVDEIWKGIIRYNGQDYRRINNDDFNWIRERINSSTTTKEDQTPLITIFDGNTEFRKDANTIFRYGINVSPVYMDNPLYKGAPVLLVPTATYDRNKSNTLQDIDAYIPVALRRIKLSDLSKDTETHKEIVSTINTLFQPNLTVRQLNQAIGTLKSKITYEFNSDNGKQQVFIVPAKQRVENGVSVVDNNGNPVIIESTAKMYDSITTKYEDTKVTYLIIQRKVDGKTVSTYTMGISQGNIYETQALPQDIQDNNKQALLDFFTNEANAYVNIDQTKLNNPDYIQKIINEGLLQTNAKELKAVANSFHMVEKVMTDADTQTEKQPEQTTTTSSIEQTVTNPIANDPLAALLGNNFNATQQAETEGEDTTKYSIVTETTNLGTINIESEVNNIMRMMPQLDKETAFDIIDSLYTINDKGDKAQGIFNKGLITLSRLAEAGTGYHEAFHLVYNMILNEEEKNAVMNEYKLSYPNLDEVELEEQMAEDFKEYSLLKEHSIVGRLEKSKFGQKLIKLFDKICNLLHIQRNNPSVFQTISANIWQSKYANRELKSTDILRNSKEKYTQEMQQIKDQAIANGTFMKASNGNPTNLNERQWLQVRTKAFKDWFGDWEKAANVPIYGREFLIDEAYNNHKFDGSTVKQYEYKELEAIANDLDVDIDFVVQIRNAQIDYYKSHKELPKSRKEFESWVWKHIYESLPKENHFLAVDKKEDVQFDLTGTKDEILDKFNELKKSQDLYNLELVNLEYPGDNTAKKFTEVFREIIEKNDFFQFELNINDYIEAVKEDLEKDVSKVVDENGEPLVVYHGSNAVFNTFSYEYFGKTDAGSLGKAFYFAKKVTAEAYAKGTTNEYGGRETVYPVFLNVKNIITDNIDKDNDFNFDNPKFNDYDGAFKWGWQYAVRNPNQIKSATDNVGTFSREDDDIRYSLPLSTKINQANLTKEDYNKLADLAQKINKSYRKGRKSGSFAVQFRTKGNETGFFLTDNSEKRVINGKETIVYHPEISKNFVEKYLKDNNLSNQFELVTNKRGDTKIMVKPNIKDKDTENNYIEYQRLVYKQREGYTLTPEEDYELQSYPNKFNTEEVCG